MNHFKHKITLLGDFYQKLGCFKNIQAA